MIRVLSAAVLVTVVSGTVLGGQSSEPLIGTWRLNVAKSKGTPLKSGTTTIQPAGQGLKFDVEFVRADGTVSKWAFTANFDGKDVPVTGNSPYGNMAALTRVDANTVRITSKQDGKLMVTSTIVVSSDGKTRTTTTKGTDTDGQPVDVVSFYDKQ